MKNDEESERKHPPVMKRPRSSKINRHGFGSPEGMEMTDFPVSTLGSQSEITPGKSQPLPQSTSIGSSFSQSPLEKASTTALTTDFTPPSMVVATLPSAIKGNTSTIDESELNTSLTAIQKEGETPKQLRKRRLFFTPSRRKSKNTPHQDSATGLNPNPNNHQQQLAMPMISPISQRIQEDRLTPLSSRTNTQSRPNTQFRTSASKASTRQSTGGSHGRRRQTGAPMPTGLSGFTTPRSGQRRQPPSSGRRGFNPLERVSDIFSPKSPSFSPASPIISNLVPDDSVSDSSYSDSSASGSVKEPFAEQVEQLDQLLATPSQQLGELAITTTDDGYRSDDDLDDEMEGLESSRRLLAEELSRVDYSLLGRGTYGSDEGVAKSPESAGQKTTKGETIISSPSPKNKADGDKDKDINWVPLLEVEARHPPNFTPSTTTKRETMISSPWPGDKDKDIDRVPLLEVEVEVEVEVEPQRPLIFSPSELSGTGATTNTGHSGAVEMLTPDNVGSVSFSRDSTEYLGDEYCSPIDRTRQAGSNNDEHHDEDKKPAAKVYQSSVSKKPPPDYSEMITKPPKKMDGKTSHEPVGTPPRGKVLSFGVDDELLEINSKASAITRKPQPSGRLKKEKNDKKVHMGKKCASLYTPPRSFPRGSEDDVKTTDDKEMGNVTQRVGESIDHKVIDEQKESKNKTTTTIDEDLHTVKTSDTATISSISGVAPEVEEDPNPAIKQTMSGQSRTADDLQLKSLKEPRTDQESLLNPPDLRSTDEARLSSVDTISRSGESSVPLTFSGLMNENLYQSFLLFAERFSDNGQVLGTGLAPTRDAEHCRRVLEHLNTIFYPTHDESRDEGEKSLHTTPNRDALRIKKAQANKEETKTKKDIVFTPSSHQENITEFSPLSQDSVLEKNDSRNEDEIPILELPQEMKSSKATQTISDKKRSKTTKSKNTSVIIPILSDDSDDYILFHKDSPQSVDLYDIGGPAPDDNEIQMHKSERPKWNRNEDYSCCSAVDCSYFSESKCKRGLLIFAILIFITGLGLVIGTTFYPDVEKTPAPSRSVTMTPTQEAISVPISISTATPSPSWVSVAPSLRPSMNTLAPSTFNPSIEMSAIPSPLPTHKESNFPTISSSISSITTEPFLPDGVSPVPSSRPPTNTLKPSKLILSTIPSENPSALPTQKGSDFPTKSPSISSFPTATFSSFRESSVPSYITSENSPRNKESETPTLFDMLSFTVPYQIFIANGLVEFVPESDYIPELIATMDLLSDDILLNIVQKKNRIREGRRLTEVVLPTSIVAIADVKCPNYIENGLCREVTAEISLRNARYSWQLFKDTTELAIEIGRLQYYLNREYPNSSLEVIDSLWIPPRQGLPISQPINGLSTNMPSDSQSAIFGSSPSSPQLSNPTLSQTTRPTAFPTSLSLLNFLKENSFDYGEALNKTSSPQYVAYSWLRDDDRLAEYSEKRLLQRYSMATFYYATNGDQWIANTHWLSNMSECAWIGKTGSQSRCNRRGELTNLELDLNNLNGLLPPELGLLSSALETISLSGGPNSDILGTLPTELGYLSRLKVFVVRDNDLSGTIPSEIENWRMLEEIDLSRNRFRGEFPTQIGILSDIKFFEVSMNYFSGGLPSELGQLRKCKSLFFEDNAFVSSIPTELGDLKELTAVNGGSNELDSLPTELGDLKSVEFISFQDSNITGPIPTELGKLRKLHHLELGNNDLSGTVPSELAQIKSLQNKLDLSYNNLSGSVPSELGLLSELRVIKLDNNLLSGIVPSELSQMSKLISIQLDSNYLWGTIPFDVCETFNFTYPAFQTDCGDFDDNCPCCTSCCVDNTCTCRYLGTSKEFLCFQRS